MALPALNLVPQAVASQVSFPARHKERELESKLETLQKDYAELNTAIFEAAQVHRRLCAPSLVRRGAFASLSGKRRGPH